MIAGYTRNISIGVGAAILLTFLFIEQRPVDPEEHDRFVRDLRVMKQSDAEVNADLISSRYELLRSYDPFVQALAEMQSTPLMFSCCGVWPRENAAGSKTGPTVSKAV